VASDFGAPVAGGLLVGGASLRFGAPKALARIGGRTFAECVAAALESATGDVALIGGGAVPASLAGRVRYPDSPACRGPLAGVLGVLRAVPGRAWLVAACDQPLLTAEALAWLLDRRRPGSIAVFARLGAGPIEPLPGLFEPASAEVLESLALAGGSLQPLAGRADVVIATPPAALAAAWTSIDTPAALARLESGGRE
jgi:molybdopterin-guanine dinucleotide biosynthesis protein A